MTTTEVTRSDVFEVVSTVLAVREFKDTPVPPETVRRIVHAAHLTASSMNGQPWKFVVVENKDTLRKLGEVIKTGAYIAQAPLAIVVAIENSQYAVSDASRAIQSMILAAWAEGVGSNWCGFRHLRQVNPLVGLPDGLEVLAVVPFGYPKEERKGKKKRKPLGEVVYRERFGTPFE